MVADSRTYQPDKEMAIRRRIGNTFNKQEEDFSSLGDYNDYLEEMEEIAHNLIQGIDVTATEAKIAKYKEDNAEKIVIAQARKAGEFAAALKATKGQPAQSVAIGMEKGPCSQVKGGDVSAKTPTIEVERGTQAGEWIVKLSKKRAFQDAFRSLWT